MWNVPRSDQYNVSAIKNIQCMIIGDVLVGKTSFLTTVATEAFPDNCPYPTVIDNHVLHVRLRNGKEVALTFWDFCKSHRFLVINLRQWIFCRLFTVIKT